MEKIKNQRGLATLLFVLLMGITAMTVTVTVVRTQDAKQEANVVAHAQTNTQLVAWAGVNAFRQYVLDVGDADIADVLALQGQSLSLDVGNSEVKVSNISVTGCAAANSSCLVGADISASSGTAKSVSSINTVFDVVVVDKGGVAGTPGTPGVGSPFSLGGSENAAQLNSDIRAANPGTEVTINVDGHLKISHYAEAYNISKLNINASGNIVIECGDILFGLATSSDSLCKNNTAVNLVAGGYITINAFEHAGILSGTKFGKLYAKKHVIVKYATVKEINALEYVEVTGTVAAPAVVNGNITAGGYVELTGVSKANDIKSGSYVELSNTFAATVSAKNITASGTVTLSAGNSLLSFSAAKADDITAGGNVRLEPKSGGAEVTTKNIYSNANVYLEPGNLESNIVAGNITAKGTVRLTRTDIISGSLKSNNILAGDSVYLLRAEAGDITSNKSVDLECRAKAQAVKYVLNFDKGYCAFWTFQGSATSSAKISAVTIPTFNVALDTTDIEDYIKAQTNEGDLKNYVSVKPYKSEANYIFTKTHGVARVYLNKLTNLGKTYLYRESDNKQLVDGSLLNGNGEPFYVGNYTLDSTIYGGAICASVDANNKCSSTIIGYLPRLSVEPNPSRPAGSIGNAILSWLSSIAFGGTYKPIEYDSGDRFIVSSIANKSSPSNANLAPGIMYFDDDLTIRGRGSSFLNGDEGSAYANSFLSEGKIEVALYSPRIYSPYNIVREGNVGDICDRVLKNADGTTVNVADTDPSTASDRYLRPTNLCKNASEFSYSMNKDADDEFTEVEIDGKQVPKLDLGFVALMAEKDIRFMVCSHIYGDVLARRGISASSQLTCGGEDRQTIEGAVITQGGTTNFRNETNIVVPPAGLSNYNGGGSGVAGTPGAPGTTGTPATSTVSVKWSKAL